MSEGEYIVGVIVGIAGAIAGRVLGLGEGRVGSLGSAVAAAAAAAAVDAAHIDDVLVGGRDPNAAYAQMGGRGIADVSHHHSRRAGGKVGVEVEAADCRSVQETVRNEGQVSGRMGEDEDESCGLVAVVT